MNNLAKIDSQFGWTQQARSSNAVANTDQQRAVAEVQAELLISRANQRDNIAAIYSIFNACTRPSLAECAIYTYAKCGSGNGNG